MIVRRFLCLLSCVSFLFCLSSCTTRLRPALPPQPVEPDIELYASRGAFLRQVDSTIAVLLQSDKGYSARHFPSKDLVLRSLSRFRDLLTDAKSAADFETQVRDQFRFYRSTDAGPGKVFFTGYYRPVFHGSSRQSERYRYPLYSLPPGLAQPGPTRRELEEGTLLKGKEIVYLDDPLDAFLAQVQGSTSVKLEEGGVLNLGFAGATQHPYVSIGAELIRDGKLISGKASVPHIREYFRTHPEELQEYLWRNNRFIFFRPNVEASGAIGSAGVSLLGGRSIATDHRLYPVGAIVLYQCLIPSRDAGWEGRPVRKYALDLDTGSAIVGPKRADIYFGEGDEAGEIAGRMQSRGDLFYLLLKE